MSDADLAKLNRLATVAKPNSALKMILNEAIDAARKVGVWANVTTSGSAVARYDPKTGNARSYDVRYQFGDAGNLVHELTHVAVNESFKQDFVNYRNPSAAPPASEYDGEGRRKNEQLRQAKWMNDGSNQQMLADLTSLLGLATGAGLPPLQANKVTEKLRYGMMNPHTEHDTVINQILIWMFEWGYPALVAPGSRAPVANNFYNALEKSVLAAYQRRNP
ncbi:MAG TPA: hypothetical protein VMG60_10305 [Burkholderiaceae bacterium]|nr:hypothetical protein [Burkholderiaceae bacterium]